MRPDNRYNRRKTLGQLLQAKLVLVLVAVCRRCKHEHVLYPAFLIERFGENTRAISVRPFLSCRMCRYRNAKLHEASRCGAARSFRGSGFRENRFTLSGGVFDIDIHPIPAYPKKSEPAHEHSTSATCWSSTTPSRCRPTRKG